MEHSYRKNRIEANPYFTLDYGKGVYHAKEDTSALHYDSAFTVSYFKHSRASVRIEGKCYQVGSGDLVIMNPNEIHCCTVDDGTYHERISLCVRKSILKSFPFDCDKLFDCFSKRPLGVGNLISAESADVYRIEVLFSELLALAEEKNRILSTCKIVELLFAISEASSFQGEDTRGVTEHTVAEQVLLYVNEHFREDLSCHDIAAHFYLSKFRLEHVFKAAVGVSLWDYVITRRLIYCHELLEQNVSVKSAAYRAGFHNYSNFYRLYKKHMGITPQAYKRSLALEGK